jgi:hypothetical protein
VVGRLAEFEVMMGKWFHLAAMAMLDDSYRNISWPPVTGSAWPVS